MTPVVVVPLWRLALVFVLALGLVVGLTGQVLIPGGNIPANGVILSTSASCPAGYAEVTQARGRMLVGIPSGGTALGTVGSAMTDAQNLSVTPTFTGSAMGTHQHTTPGLRTDGTVSTTAPYGLGSTFSVQASVTFGAGAGSGTGMLSEGISAGTPAGTVSAVTTGALAPYVQVMLCRRS